jgi:uncharacterized protein (TIGR03067 family)
MMKARALLVLAVALCVAADKPKADEAKKELARLQGTWVMEALEVNGENVPAKKLAGTTLTIKGDRYITKVKDTAREVTFKLDPSEKPKAIDMYFPDGPELPKLSKGIYELDGDTLKVCRHQTPGEDRPRSFVTSAGTNLFVVTWKRKKP